VATLPISCAVIARNFAHLLPIAHLRADVVATLSRRDRPAVASWGKAAHLAPRERMLEQACTFGYLRQLLPGRDHMAFGAPARLDLVNPP
jgi:hypothetical protein